MSTKSCGDDVVDEVVGTLARLRGVEAVALGGSRATGTAGPESDWDLAIYYRSEFDPAEIAAARLQGTVSAIGGWGGGVFNGGAWLTEKGRRIDVHYRDLAVVESEITAAEKGSVRVEPLLFHLVGIPTYLLVAELAVNKVLAGELPRPRYPQALREEAPGFWRDRAELEFEYVRSNHARRGDVTAALGMLAVAATSSAHAILAARGEWVTNEKGLVRRAGLGAVDDFIRTGSDDLMGLATRIADLCRAELERCLTRR